jgi:hypothetical protein
VHRVKRARSQVVETTQEIPRVAGVPSGAAAVFISHSSGDNDFAVKLSRDLQQRGITTWVDRRQLRPGMAWPDEIRRSLERAQTVLLVLSPLALESEAVRQEYQTAVTRHKHVLVLRLDASCKPPSEVAQAPIVDFATLYVNGLADLLAVLHADQGVVAAARRTLRQRLRYAWLISTVRVVASSYLFLSRILVFAVASLVLLGGFDHIVGVDNLATYLLIWLGRALPGAGLGVLVSLEERARVEGARSVWWMSLARVVNGTVTGEGMLGVWSVGIGGLFLTPATWLAVLFLVNQTPAALIATDMAQHAAEHTSGPVVSLVVSAVIIGIGLVNGALAVPLARSEKRNREQGKHGLLILSAIAGLSARIGLGALGLVVPLYVLFDSPVDPFGPPTPTVLGGIWIWVLCGLGVGAVTGAIELFFFPAGPSRRALKTLRAVVLSRPV